MVLHDAAFKEMFAFVFNLKSGFPISLMWEKIIKKYIISVRFKQQINVNFLCLLYPLKHWFLLVSLSEEEQLL